MIIDKSFTVALKYLNLSWSIDVNSLKLTLLDKRSEDQGLKTRDKLI